MPELPEVTTAVRSLQKVLPKLIILDIWTDLSPTEKIWKTKKRKNLFKNTLKDPFFYKKFKKEVKNAKILKVERRGKNILIHLNNKKTILIHLKMTGHLLFGKYIKVMSDKKSPYGRSPLGRKIIKWIPAENEKAALFDSYNRFIHAVFSLSKNKYLVFCDARKFGKITLIPTNKLYKAGYGLDKLGPEPLDSAFSLKNFQERLQIKKHSKIKTVLMEQSVIVGIGNIYSDEMLWLSGIHPESIVKNIPKLKLKLLYTSMQKVLYKGISLGGDSTSDYRHIDGKKGKFHEQHNAYKKENENCSKKNCKGVILRKVINGRSAHYCNFHQELF